MKPVKQCTLSTTIKNFKKEIKERKKFKKRNLLKKGEGEEGE
jgi:hypothetical protein